MTAPKVSGWLLLAASLPGRQSGTARVRLWRALKDAGAASLRDGVTLVPALPAIRERLAAIAKDIEKERDLLAKAKARSAVARVAMGIRFSTIGGQL